MNWGSINVFQFQQITKAIEEEDTIKRNLKLISIVNNWTINKVNSLTIDQYNHQLENIKFLDVEVKGEKCKYIDINKRRYKVIYDVRKLNAARYIETKVFSESMVDNLHKIAASMVVPMKKTFWGWKEDNYDASNHDQYAQDMLEAKFVNVYFSVVFFCQVLNLLTDNMLDYLKKELKKK